jgi:hypothetical protein
MLYNMFCGQKTDHPLSGPARKKNLSPDSRRTGSLNIRFAFMRNDNVLRDRRILCAVRYVHDCYFSTNTSVGSSG